MIHPHQDHCFLKFSFGPSQFLLFLRGCVLGLEPNNYYALHLLLMLTYGPLELHEKLDHIFIVSYDALMDLLCSAYSTASDEDEGDNGSRRQPMGPELPLPKRVKMGSPLHKPGTRPVYCHVPSPSLPTEAPIAGRYISKRERAGMTSGTVVHAPNPPSLPVPSPGTISASDLPHNILLKLRNQRKHFANLGQIPHGVSIALHGHTKPVNTIQWSRSHAHLLASAGMDHTVSIWNVWSRAQKRARVLNFHNAAVKDVKWSEQGLYVLSCGYDCTSRLVDVERGTETQVFKEDQVVGVVKFHPYNFNLFLSGGSKGLLRLWDTRTGKVGHEYMRSLGPILDAEFSVDGKQLISSSDESRSNVSENSVIVWDVSREVPLSNQVYVEAFTCPCIRFHPLDPYFIAQSNGNYIAIFSARSPFKLDKYKRYEGHGVFGFPIKCNFSSDGNVIGSGSADGCIYFYDSKSSRVIRKMKAHEQACIDVAFHPIIPNVLATSGWNGEVLVLE